MKSKPSNNPTFNIIDIRHDGAEIELKDEILASLTPKSGLKSLPTLLLYDERGLQIYEEVGLCSRHICCPHLLTTWHGRSLICRNIT